ncbi:unnamed protein product [Lactuca saligna]|uniref:Uncharacterized protein n=1 Tax=Lactuca saligna TaxID=75948 RepID=A0AA35YN47_LACSI|nr:unnamed protein product [Lactuca saligna]
MKELAEEVQLLEEEQRKFDERYLVLSGEKNDVEDQVATLDGEVLHKGVVRMVDLVVESRKFMLGIRRVMVVCVATGIEREKQMAHVWSAGSGPGSSDLDAATWLIDAMHAAIRAFPRWTSCIISIWASSSLLIFANYAQKRRISFQTVVLRALPRLNLAKELNSWSWRLGSATPHTQNADDFKNNNIRSSSSIGRFWGFETIWLKLEVEDQKSKVDGQIWD